MNTKNIVGITEFVRVNENKNFVPAKIDTGALSTAVSAHILEINKSRIKFILFCEGDEFYDGVVQELNLKKVTKVRSSNGIIQERCKVIMPIEIGGKKFETEVNLSDRRKNTYPILVGAETLREGGFLVDPAIDKVKLPMKKFK